MFRLLTIFLSMAVLIPMTAIGQKSITLDLRNTIRIAGDSSLMSLKNQNLYMSGFWEYRSYRADRLPSLSQSITPVSYNRYITQRYNYEDDIDVFRAQQLYSASGGFTVSQNFDPLGGTFYIESHLEYMRNFGNVASTQYTSIPVRVGYRQSLLGYNKFRWDRRIEPLKFEKVRKELIYNMEVVAESAVTYFFQLALAQAEYRLAVENLSSCDTLYTIGERRFKIASISQSDLLTLKLDKVNAKNAVENTRIALKRAMFSLASFLGLDKDTHIELILPSSPAAMDIPTEKAVEYAMNNSPDLMQNRVSILEAEREVSKTKAESRFNANINASVGFNQVSDSFSDAYLSPKRQDLVSLSISIPLLDWGVRKGKLNMAKNKLNVLNISARQDENNIEEDVIMTINDFNIQKNQMESALEALDLAETAYAYTRQRFIIGKETLSSLTLSLNRQQDANKNYINTLKNYWLSYYKIRKLTLFDFELNMPIESIFDYEHGIR